MTMLEGGCRCGAIRYGVTADPLTSFACHCTDCQHLSASAYSLALVVPKAAFGITKGEPQGWSKTGSSGKPSHQFTCPTCATWTHTKPESAAEYVIVRPMSLDEHAWFRPVAQIFTRSALPWASMPTLLSYESEFEDPAPLLAAYRAGGIGHGRSPK
jgi:hypothetical protein